MVRHADELWRFGAPWVPQDIPCPEGCCLKTTWHDMEMTSSVWMKCKICWPRILLVDNSIWRVFISCVLQRKWVAVIWFNGGTGKCPYIFFKGWSLIASSGFISASIVPMLFVCFMPLTIKNCTCFYVFGKKNMAKLWRSSNFVHFNAMVVIQLKKSKNNHSN